ncbi:hypothetical protein PILCRDRAFT_75230, partial [Piloderma croceum F 1598]
ERYHLTSQHVAKNKILEFYNLYFDFNGIIHNCSHPNDGDAHFRLSEEQIYIRLRRSSLLEYKTPENIFIAVDGVDSRAKMNQQRSRRFQTAQGAKELKEKAERNGEKLPHETAFDIPSWAKMNQQRSRRFQTEQGANELKEKAERNGEKLPHETAFDSKYITPGESPKSLLALLVILTTRKLWRTRTGMEIKFGLSKKKKKKKGWNGSLLLINFYLLHLSLIPECLDLEFRDIEPTLPFDCNLEHVIDDFILPAVFVGNDFLLHPGLHIHENGLERLFDVYKKNSAFFRYVAPSQLLMCSHWLRL